jgi:hypothetical protein
MSCNCHTCMEQDYFKNNFPPGTKIIVSQNYSFPSKFPKTKQKNLTIDYYDPDNESFFISAPINEGGFSETVNGKVTTGFWITKDYVALKEQHIASGSKVRIIDPNGDLYLNVDLKEHNEFEVATYQHDPISDEFGNYFLIMENGDSSYDGEDGEWIDPTYLQVIENKKEEKKAKQEVQEKSMTAATTSTSLETCFKKAGVRSASRTAILAVRKALVRIVKRHYEKQSQDKQVISNNLKVIQGLLDSPIGQGVLGVLSGFLLTKIPKLNEKEDVKDVAEELIVEGMSVGMDEVIAFGVENVLPEVLPLLESLPGTEELKAMLPSLDLINSAKNETEKTTKRSSKKKTAKTEKPALEKKEEPEIEEVIVGANGSNSTRQKNGK